jgi:hypothetical protein
MIRLDLVKQPAKFAWVILLLLSVIAIFVSPAVDLQPTALRAMQCAGLLFAVLLLARTVIGTRYRVLPSQIALFVERHFVVSPPLDLLALNCARLR